MKLADTNYDNAETGCCARLDQAKWHDKTWVWNNKPFLKDHIRAFMHIPLNFGSVISRDHKRIEEAGAYPEDPLWLTDELSPWGSDIHVALDRDALPGANVEKLSGTFYSRVYEGSYRDIGHWIHAMQDAVHERGLAVRKLYFFYATCPRCAKTFGKNQVVLFAQTE